MLCYAEKNGALAAIVDSAGSIMTFSDSRFSIKSGEPSINLGFLRNTLLDDNCAHFFKVMFTCTDSSSRKYAAKLISNCIIRSCKLFADLDPELRETNPLAIELKEGLRSLIG